MKLFTTLLLAILVLTSCSPQTKEEIEFQKWQQEQVIIKQDKDRAFELEQLKVKAEIEKAKPESIKLQEVKNEETTVWEGLQNAAGIAWAAAVGLGIIHLLSK